MPPLVSVVVPTYDRPSFLREAVRSVAAQTYDRTELVVVDDCSPEPAAPVVEAVDTGGLVDVRCLRHDENRGANAARNTGIRAADGEVVAFLDDDDRWTPTVAERYVGAFREAGPDVGLVTVGTRILDDEGREIGRHLPRIEGDALEALLDGTLVGSFSRFAVRDWAVEAAGLLDEELPSWQDWEWQFRLAYDCEFAAVPEPLVVGRRGSHGQITDDFRDRRDVSYPRLLARHRAEVGRRVPDGEARLVALLSRTLASAALRTGRYGAAVRYLLRSLRHDPWTPETYLYLGLAAGGPVTYGVARRAKRRLTGAR